MAYSNSIDKIIRTIGYYLVNMKILVIFLLRRPDDHHNFDNNKIGVRLMMDIPTGIQRRRYFDAYYKPIEISMRAQILLINMRFS